MLTTPIIHTLSLSHPSRADEQVSVTYYEWGSHNADLLLCVHGLSRNGRDFDFLASALSTDYRVISLDMPGRGKSPNLPHTEDYDYKFYAALLGAFIDALEIKHCDWVGTSMGGILGMMLAVFRPNLIGRLVLNDMGAFVAGEGLRRIAHYLGNELVFKSRAEAETYMRTNYTSFGLTEEWQWQHVFTHSIVPRDDGLFTFAYDQAIMDATKRDTHNYTHFKDVDLWPLWKLVACPVFIIRGKNSDILNSATAHRMLQRKIPTELYEVENVGHAPALMDEAQIGKVKNWLLSTAQQPRSGWLSKARAWCIRKLLPLLVRR